MRNDPTLNWNRGYREWLPEKIDGATEAAKEHTELADHLRSLDLGRTEGG